LSKQLLDRANEPGGGYEKDIGSFILGFYIRRTGRDPDLLDIWTVADHSLHADRGDRKGPQVAAAKYRLFHRVYATLGRPVRSRKIDRFPVATPSKLDRRQQLHR